MKTITDIKQQIKNKKRVSVYLDGSYYCSLDLVTAVQNRLKAGMEISEEKLVEIQYNSEFQNCFDSALNFISVSPKTKKQIRDKLIQKGYLEEIVLKVLDKLAEYGYVNDSDYAEKYVNSYKGQKGKKLIKLELLKKGIKEEDFKEAVDGVETQAQAISRLAEKYMRNKDCDLKTIKKLYSHLISKGFDYDEVKEITSIYLEKAQSEEILD